MSTYVALLRAINVGGLSVKMAALRESLAALKYDPITTYLQSGNVVFGARKATPTALRSAIERRLAEDFGSSIRVLVLPASSMAKVAKENPFLAEKGIDATKCHVTWLFDPPSKAAFEKLAAIPRGPDRYHVNGAWLYLHCPEGYGNSKLANPNLERALGVKATTRNWNTVTALMEMLAD
jgi:uncharacterized protein (DUF1697 family)